MNAITPAILMELLQTSIVFVASGNPPQLYSKEFLYENEIIPADISTKKSVNIPPLSQHQYENGVLFEATENKIKLEANFGQGLQIDVGQRVPDFLGDSAARLLDVATFLPFSAVGLNFKIAVPDASIESLVHGIPDSASAKIVRYDVESEAFSIRLTLNSARRRSDDANIVVADSNGHHDVIADTKDGRLVELREILDRRNWCFKENLRLLHDTRF